MVETIILVVVILVAAIAVGLKLYKTATGKGGCSCGGSCSSNHSEGHTCCGGHNHKK